MELNNAPVAEVVVGVQFKEDVFKNNFIFDFYQKIKSGFPIVQEHKPIVSIIEKIDAPNENIISQGFHSRKFFLNGENTKLIQLQSNRFLFNWRKTNDKDEYPHFSVVLGEFVNIFNTLKKDLKVDEMINQLEVTYVDHIYIDDFGYKNYCTTDILNIFNFDKNLKNIDSTISYPFSKLNGNVTLNLKSGERNSDKRKLFVLESTCRGALGANSMKQWLVDAHTELLNLFESIITDKAKKIWECK